MGNSSILSDQYCNVDYINLFLSGSDIIMLIDTFSLELRELRAWFQFNRSSLNLSTVRSVLFTLNASIRSGNLPLVNDNVFVECVHITKFLGVFIDKSQESQQDVESIQLLNNTFMLQYLSYCHTIWGKAPLTHISILVTLQKKCVRIVCHAPLNSHSDPNSKDLSISDLHPNFSVIFIYKHS